MKFELIKEMMVGRHLGEKESIDTFGDFFEAEQNMLEYVDANLPNGFEQIGPEIQVNGNTEYIFDDEIKPETWNIGDRTGMACGDFTLWITRIL